MGANLRDISFAVIAEDKASRTLARVGDGMESVGKLSAALKKAHLAEADAAGRVRVAQARLADTLAGGKAKTSQLAAAEEALAKAQRNLSASGDTARDIRGKLAKAEAAAASDVQKTSRRLGGRIVDGAASEADKRGSRAFMSVGRSMGGGMRVGLIQSFGDVGRNLTGVFAGLAAIRVFGTFIQDARESAKVGRLTDAVIKSTGASAGITADEVGKLATAISNKTGIDDEQIQSAENLLLTFTNVRNEVGKGNDVFSQAAVAAVDMSVALGTDASKSAIQLGKALNDPIKGITALSKAGVSFTAQQKAQIKTLVESGHILAAQKIILAELGKEFGGAAEAAADPIAKLKVIAGNLGETIGGLLLPVVSSAARLFADLAPKVDAVAGFIDGLPAPVKAAALTIGGLALAVKLLSPLAQIPGRLADGFDRLVDVGGRTEVAGGKIATAGSRIASAFKGALLSISPLTLAIGAAATIVALYAKNKAEARQRVEDFTRALEQDSGAIGENTRALVAQRLEQSGALQAARDLGINLGIVTDAALGNATALAIVNSAIHEQITATREQVLTGSKNVATQLGNRDAASKLAGAVNGSNTEITQAIEKQGRLTEATGPSTTAIKDQTTAANTAKLSITDLTTALFALVGINADAATTDIAFRDSLARLTESVKANGTSIGLTTQKGRDNRSAVIASIEAAQRHAEAVGKQTGKESEARKAFENSIPQIREQARRLGLNRAQVDALIASIAKLKPKTVPVKAAVSVVDVTASGRVTAPSGQVIVPGRASGGPIPGSAPHDRADNRLIRATPGEWVIQKPTVRKLERQRPGIMAAINAGQVEVGGDPGTMRIGRFASGGLVRQVQMYLKAQAGEPYIWGGVGPFGGDCSGYVGNAYGLLTGRPANRRYFTTATIGRAQGFRPGKGTFTVGVTAGSGHMAGNLAGLRFEATPPSLRVGARATPVTSFARQFYLPSAGGIFGGMPELTANQKRSVFRQIRPEITRQIIRELKTADRGTWLPPHSTSMVQNGTSQWEPVGPPGGNEELLAELRGLRADLARLPSGVGREVGIVVTKFGGGGRR